MNPSPLTQIPFMDLVRVHAPLRDALVDAATRVIDSGVFIGGPEVESLEQALASMIGVKHAIGVSSGSDALLVSLMALQVQPGDEVITSPLSFFATIGAILRLGAVPVFADIDPQTFNLDPAQVKAKLSPRTRAILPVHLFGQLAPMDDLLAIAAEYGVAVIEDAAQAIGAANSSGQAGALGALGCFSFFPTKNLGALGDGGLVTTQDDALAQRVRALARHGTTRKYQHDLIGGNFRLDPIQAAMLRVKLPHLAAWNARRSALAARYAQALHGIEGLILPTTLEGNTHTFHQYCVRAPGRRDALMRVLNEAGIGTMIYYPSGLHEQPCLSALNGVAGQHCPQASLACQELLALPIYPGLRDDEQARIIEVIHQAFSDSMFSS